MTGLDANRLEALEKIITTLCPDVDSKLDKFVSNIVNKIVIILENLALKFIGEKSIAELEK